ncbi:Uncharacterised protein [uncultured archaeon]|nr:Uncharacterised protein [uncultured archaeon]
MEEEATFTFTTKKGAEIFQSQILDKMGGVSFRSRISEEKGQYIVYFQGRSDPKKEAGSYNETFSNELMGETVSSDITSFPVGTHGESRIKTKYEGDAAKYTDAEMLEAAKGKDIDFSKGEGKAYLETFVALTLAVHNYAPNEASREEMEQYTRAAFRQLAEKCGYSGSNAIEDFLKSGDGEAFVSELRAAVKRGDFMFFTSASSEWLVSQGGLKDLIVSQIGNSQQRGDLALEYINELLVKSGQQQISGVPIVRVVWPLEELSEANREKLISLGMEQISGCPKEVKERVRGYLETQYSNENINANFQRIFGQVYSDAQNGDSEATRVWNALKKSAIGVDTSGAEPVFSIKSASALNTLVSLKHSPIRKNASYFDNVLGETTRYASFEMAADMDVSITIGNGEKKGDLMYVPLEVSQNAAWKSGDKETKFEGIVDGSVWTEDGKKVKDARFEQVNGQWFAVFKPEAGVKYSVVAYATNDQNTISTGLVKRGVEAEEELDIDYPVKYALPLNVMRGANNVKIPMEVYLQREDKIDPMAARYSFGLKLRASAVTNYFITPNECKVEGSQYVYEVDGGKVAVGRDLTYNGKTIYTSEQLASMLKKGIVGFSLKDESGKPISTDKGETRWFALDGSEIKKGAMDESTYNGVQVLKPKGKVVYSDDRHIDYLNAGESVEIQEKKPLYSRKYFIPNYIILPENDVVFGKGKNNEYTLSAGQIRKLASEHIIAIVARRPRKDDASQFESIIYGLDGRELGPLSELLTKQYPKVEGIAVERGALTPVKFNWPVDHIPNVDDVDVLIPYIHQEMSEADVLRKRKKR